MISILMLKLCDKSICKPYNIIFKSCLTQDIIPSEWKRANFLPIPKKTTSSMLKTTHLTLFYEYVAIL